MTLRTEVAVKFPSLPVRGRAATAALDRFRFEAQVAARLGVLTRHVVAVHDAGCEALGPYLVMEYVRGRHAAARSSTSACALPPARVAAVVEQVAEALAAAHGARAWCTAISSRRTCSSTTDADGALLVKVADFGIAKALTARPGRRPAGGHDGRLHDRIAAVHEPGADGRRAASTRRGTCGRSR